MSSPEGCAVVNVSTWKPGDHFRPGSDAGPDSDDVYEAKLTALAGTISGLAPDVLAVQEVGEPEARWLTWWIVLAASGTPRWLEPDGRGIRVAVLSRLGP